MPTDCKHSLNIGTCDSTCCIYIGAMVLATPLLVAVCSVVNCGSTCCIYIGAMVLATPLLVAVCSVVVTTHVDGSGGSQPPSVQVMFQTPAPQDNSISVPVTTVPMVDSSPDTGVMGGSVQVKVAVSGI